MTMTNPFRIKLHSTSLIIAALMLAPQPGLVAAIGERELREECSASALSQIEFGECLEKKRQESASELQSAETLMRTALTQWDEDAYFVHQAQEMFTVAANAFTAYRELQCEFARSRGGGGVHSSTFRLACETELNLKRAAELRDAASLIPQK
jgi:uncharacterized protein YecT (DUF1311 family)